MELIIAMAMLTIIFAVVLPQFAVIRNSWDIKQSSAEILQNGRVLMDHINRNLAKARQIVAVSSSSIDFNDCNDVTWRYNIGAENYVQFGQPGSMSDLAGPVSSLVFTCYDACDFGTPITTPADVRVVEVDATVTNSVMSARSMSFTTEVYLRVNSQTTSELPEGIVGWWKMDETSGTTVADCTCNSNDGVLRNMVGNEWTDGVVGGALNFDGSNDYVAIQNLFYDSSGYAEVSVTAWIRTTDGGNQIIASYDRNEYWRLEINGNGGGTGQIGWDVRTSSGQVDYGSVTRVDDGTWHHVAAVFDNGTLTIYIDGNPEPSTSGGSTFGRGVNTRYGFLGVGSEATTFDGSRGPNNYFDGDMDDVRIYNRALSAEEISQLAETLRYQDFNEAKSSSGVTLTIDTPSTDTGDLLIAAVATDGDTSSTLSPPSGWTEIDVDDYSSAVTLGVWWRIATVSEPATHQFSWTGARPAYGWIMRFTGQDTTNPINASASGEVTSSSPTSPAVTATADGCLILRLGAFDGSDITVDAPGLSGHTAITMDQIGVELFQDDFDVDDFAHWTTDWERDFFQKHSGFYSAQADRFDGYLTSENINTSAYSSFTVEFWYRDYHLDDSDNVYLRFYDGSSYDYIFELGNTSPESTWYFHQETVTDAQYCRSNFRIRFDGSNINSGSEYIWIDDVLVSAGGVSGGAGYIRQSSAGSSGTSNFALTASQEARMLTIAIAPDSSGNQNCCPELRP